VVPGPPPGPPHEGALLGWSCLDMLRLARGRIHNTIHSGTAAMRPLVTTGLHSALSLLIVTVAFNVERSVVSARPSVSTLVSFDSTDL